jgi:fatty-acyl-CoA synthase
VHRSPHAALGYYNDEDKTAEAFRGGWFHSGDLGVDEDGYLSVVDRKKDMIKTGGENVSSREVEEAIYALDGVAEVAVFGITHPHWIEAVTAVIVPKDGVALTDDRSKPTPGTAWPATSAPSTSSSPTPCPRTPAARSSSANSASSTPT